MLVFGEDIMLLQVSAYLASDDMFHDFRTDTGEGNRAIVNSKMFRAFLVNGDYIRLLPVKGHLSCPQGASKDSLQDRSSSFTEFLKHHGVNLIGASRLVRFQVFQ